MDLVTIKPPKFDCDVFADVTLNKGKIPVIKKFRQSEILDGDSERSESPKSTCLDFEDDMANDFYLCLGMSKGTIIFVRVDNLEYIYSRFSIHRQSIDHLTEIRSQQRIVTMCSEYIISLWGFVGGKLHVFQKYNMCRPVTFIKNINDYVTIILKNGESCVLYCNGNEFLKLNYDISMEHDEKVEVIDFLPSKGLMATADADGLIKIWNAKKELIREVKFNEEISSVSFMNVKGDLLVGHQG